ncbi:MAG TPA: DUF1318 domain-containing protein [Candidatus Binatia bacterium]|nr:DUF1318 domain-containing protein [Candidatus Binatia bacterium]
MNGWLRSTSLAFVLGGCVAVTINVTFPQESIDRAASSIEELVRTPKEPPPPSPAPSPPSGRSAPVERLTRWLEPAAAEAQALPELKTRTPEVMAIIASRRARWGDLSAAMARGCVGENNQGLVEARPASGCPPDLAELVAAENRDRLALYRTLVEQNRMPPEDLARVQAGFARENRARVPAGTWVQDTGGAWTRK